MSELLLDARHGQAAWPSQQWMSFRRRGLDLVDAFAEEEVEKDEAGIDSCGKKYVSAAVEEAMAVDSEGQGPDAARGEVGDGNTQVCDNYLAPHAKHAIRVALHASPRVIATLTCS